MLGLRIAFTDCMFPENRFAESPLCSPLRALLLGACLVLLLTAPLFGESAERQQARLPSGKGGIVNLSAVTQSRRGDLFIADGDVDITYEGARLRADHVEFNEKTKEAVASGHVQFDYANQHLDGDQATYNVRTGHGIFQKVRGSVKIERRPNSSLLVTDNPLYFEAKEVERVDESLYIVRGAWVTVCDPERPKWKFYAPRARIRLEKNVALVNANFRMFRVPLIWLPYATAPAGRKVRQSGFLIPDIGNSSRKGFILGDAFYWAPFEWMDTTLSGQLLSRRGSAERGEFRARPWENTSIHYDYFGVIDRGLKDSNGVRNPQGGHQQQFEVQSLLPKGWRAVIDANELSSLTFRLAFADTYGDAINAEVRSALFLTNNFRGFSLNFADLSDRSFLSAPTRTAPPITVMLRNAPEARFSSVDQSPWKRVPVYFGLAAFADAVHREDPNLDTPGMVEREEFAPRVTVPLHAGPWLSLTTTAAFRGTRYGASLDATGAVNPQAITRNTGEFALDFRPPSLEKIFERPKSNRKWKHTVEPGVIYRYVTGVNDFGRFIRFDSDATLTDTSEVEYGITQRLFRKEGDNQPEELFSWRIVQKHFFDPTFGGAIVPGTRNVFQALNSITPFAFADGPRNWSPIVSDFKVTPGGRYDAEEIVEYDNQRRKLTTFGTLLKVKPYSQFYATIAHFRLDANPILQPLSNQIRGLIGYGELNRKGLSATGGVSYDLTNHALQNQLVQISYNGGCCGIALEYRRIALGQVRTENQFRVALILANIGTFGNLRRQERIF